MDKHRPVVDGKPAAMILRETQSLVFLLARDIGQAPLPSQTAPLVCRSGATLSPKELHAKEQTIGPQRGGDLVPGDWQGRLAGGEGGELDLSIKKNKKIKENNRFPFIFPLPQGLCPAQPGPASPDGRQTWSPASPSYKYPGCPMAAIKTNWSIRAGPGRHVFCPRCPKIVSINRVG